MESKKEESLELSSKSKKPYAEPKIIYELDLEARAGSPIPPNMPNPLDDSLP